MWTTLMKLDLASVGIALSLGLISVVLFEIFRMNSYRSRTPPGPRPLPFVGTIPYLLKNPMEFIRSLSQYGEMATVYLGRKPAIILNTVQLVKEALVQNASSFSGRPYIPLISWITGGFGIIFVTFGDAWRQQRRFALHTLRNFGLGKKSVNERVTEESRYLVLEMLKSEGKPFNIQHTTQNAVSNIICSIVFGDRFDYDDKRFAYLLKILNENIFLTGSVVGQVFNLLPIIKYFPGPQQKVYQSAEELKAFIREAVRNHRETLDPDSPRDFIDAYLLEIEKGTQILINLTAILTEKEHWKFPDTFNPENFLDDSGNFFKPESFLAFSLGPRVCLGETLAKTELFLFITSLLQRIRFSWPPGVKWPDMNGVVGAVRSPEPFDIICHSRGS
ncbi:cytochrome P450 2J6 [Carassius gibelio]|uniref:cytochrome P450 2J6 n=1 Tax=Carassius gibelio TaxID=101364 RepID=UPI002277E764|nr:cytochrome P450 2J6 [Carassius gibelio]